MTPKRPDEATSAATAEPIGEFRFKQPAGDSWLSPGRFALLLACLLLASFPGVVLRGQIFTARDFGMFSYPVAFFHREAFWRGALPLWNPLNYCGLPFLAQWNTMSFYPGTAIYLLLPMPWSLSFFCLVHVFWGGVGMYFLVRHWTKQNLAGGVAGIVFAFSGLTLNFIMWPSHIATFSWLPWVIWLAPQGWEQGGHKLFWATLACSLQMIAGGPETILLTWVLLSLLACGDLLTIKGRTRTDGRQHTFVTGREAGPTPCMLEESAASTWQLCLRFVGLVSLVACICAAQLLPFLELLRHSERTTGYSASSHDWSMPTWGWASFLVPLFHTVPNAQNIYFQVGQYWTSSYYVGIATIFLTVVALRRALNWRLVLLAGASSLCLVLALGDDGFLFKLLRFCIPQVGFVRYPVKFLILVSALAPLMAGVGFAALSNQPALKFKPFEKAVVLSLLGLICLTLILEWRTPMLEGAWRLTWHNGLTRAVFFALLLFCGAQCLRSDGRRRILAGLLLLMVIWLDLITHVPTQNPSISPLVYTPGLARAKLAPEEQPYLGQGRVMLSAAAEETLRLNALPNLEQHFLVRRMASFPDCNLLDDIPEVYGFFSLAPRHISNLANLPYVQKDVDFSRVMDFMAVTRTTKPGTLFDWAPRPSAMPLVTVGQKAVFADDQSVINAFFQTNTDLRQIVFLPVEARGQVKVEACPTARVLNVKFENEQVEFVASCPEPAMMVISQAWYPGWKAYIDGKSANLWRANYAFQALQVPTGEHLVKIRFQDGALDSGLVISLLGLIFWALLGYTSNKRAASVP